MFTCNHRRTRSQASHPERDCGDGRRGVKLTQHYLQKLRRLRLVDRHIPVTESPMVSKRGWYHIAAPLFRFWFRFVYGSQGQLHMLGDDAYDELVASELADYVSPLFERLCQRALPDIIDWQFRDIGQ